jgi:hypothetical protein
MLVGLFRLCILHVGLRMVLVLLQILYFVIMIVRRQCARLPSLVAIAHTVYPC